MFSPLFFIAVGFHMLVECGLDRTEKEGEAGPQASPLAEMKVHATSWCADVHCLLKYVEDYEMLVVPSTQLVLCAP